MPAQFPQKDKKKRGYCECCGKKYEDLQTVREISSICFDTIVSLMCGITRGFSIICYFKIFF